MTKTTHTPVLLQETIEALAVQPGGRYIDCTVGGGGHAAAILKHSSPGGQLLGIDADPDALKKANRKLAPHYSSSILLINDNFVNLQNICIKYDFFPVHGILFDLGLSSLQLSDRERGFSFQQDSPLDMRFSPDQDITAADIVNTFTENRLASILATFGEESYSKQIARNIIRERPVTSTRQLAGIVEQTIGNRRGKIHPATKTFQALRIAVNQELKNLQSALKQAVDILGFEGRLVVISYHSLEDRIVKQFMRQEAKDCVCPPEAPKCICDHKASLRLASRKVITPSPAEIYYNPRSRSAKLRVAERVSNQSEYFDATEEYSLPDDFDTRGWRKPALLKKLKVTFSAS